MSEESTVAVVWVVESQNEHGSVILGVYRTRAGAFACVETQAGGAVRLHPLEGSEASYVGKGRVFGWESLYLVSRHVVEDDGVRRSSL